ncbi:hypothetical protein B7Y94_04910 [Candidatus Saccharibacteria bacterium 32-49-12]|nr:MAG: hypothetical protein B7Y94_04910 [Candidatus Saccharibacteria bacterium 32-49-12]
MDIEEFVKDVLGQVTRSVNDNKSGGKTKYHVSTADGISFDLAVATSSTTTKTKGITGGMKVKVIGAEGSKSEDTQDKHEQSSRVKFKVSIYTQSDDDGIATAGSYDPDFSSY